MVCKLKVKLDLELCLTLNLLIQVFKYGWYKVLLCIKLSIKCKTFLMYIECGEVWSWINVFRVNGLIFDTI